MERNFKRQWRQQSNLRLDQSPNIGSTAVIKHAKEFSILPTIDGKRKLNLETERLAATTKKDYNMAKRMIAQESQLSVKTRNLLKALNNRRVKNKNTN